MSTSMWIAVILGHDLAVGVFLGWIWSSVRRRTRAFAVLSDGIAKLAGIPGQLVEARLRKVEDLVKRAGWEADANRQALERLGERLADLEPWGQDNSDQVDDDDSTGDDLSDVPFTVVQTLPPVGGFLRRLSDAIPALTSSYSVVCPACETVNKSEGVPPVRCVGCQAELPERQWPF